jgi:hypothetical protein
MLYGAFLSPKKPDDAFIASLRTIRNVKWEIVVSDDIRNQNGVHEKFFSPNCNMICVADPDFTSYNFLAGLVRKGCHLFLPEKQMMSCAERVNLMRLAEEGNTSIQIRNDFRFHPAFLIGKNIESKSKLIEIHQVAPGKTDFIQELLFHNVLMVLSIADSEPSRISVCSIPNSSFKPDVVNIHLNFHNGSAASLTLSFHGRKKEHNLSVHDSTGVTKLNLMENSQQTSGYPAGLYAENASGDPVLLMQITRFAESILKMGFERIELDKEESTFRLIEKINQKMEFSEILV